jgi:hypothetical protein
MAYTVPQLRELLEAEELRYYLIPDREGVMLNLNGEFGKFQFLILLESDGEFLQFRSTDYLHCPRDHPNLDATLQTLGELNYRLRILKFGWDPADGEIAAYIDLWIMDAEITQEQFSRMVQAYMTIIDDEYPKLKEAIENGVGPGDSDDEDQGEDDSGVIDSL